MTNWPLHKDFDGEQCAALDDNGRRCRRIATHADRYHGDQELYGFFSDSHLPWVRVALCEKHRITVKR